MEAAGLFRPSPDGFSWPTKRARRIRDCKHRRSARNKARDARCCNNAAVSRAGRFGSCAHVRASWCGSSSLTHITAQPRSSSSNATHICRQRKDMISDSICRVVACVQTCFNPKTISNGFAKTGQLVDGLLNFDARLRCTRHTFTDQQYSHILSKKDELVSMMKQSGYVTEAQYDSLGIVNVNPGCSRDDLVFSRQRAMVFI